MHILTVCRNILQSTHPPTNTNLPAKHRPQLKQPPRSQDDQHQRRRRQRHQRKHLQPEHGEPVPEAPLAVLARHLPRVPNRGADAVEILARVGLAFLAVRAGEAAVVAVFWLDHHLVMALGLREVGLSARALC